MNTNIIFGKHVVESVTLGDEVYFFEVEEDSLLPSLWSVGDDDFFQEELDNDCLSLYNEH